VIPDRVLAEGSGAVWTMQIQGSARTAAFHLIDVQLSGGMGARATKSGPSATCYPTGVAAVPVEIVEAVTPVLFDRKELRRGSGGEGAMRGGDGQIIQFRLQTNDEWLLTRLPAGLTMAGSLGGGAPGAAGKFHITVCRCATSRSSSCSRMTSYCLRRQEVAATDIVELRSTKFYGEENHDEEITCGAAAFVVSLSAAPAWGNRSTRLEFPPD